MKLIKMLKVPVFLSLAMFIICGFAYPLVITGFAQLLFPHQANGSLIQVNGEMIGSELVGQDFTDPRLMKCRPSAVNYNVYTDEEKEDGSYEGVGTGSDNYANTNPDLKTRVEQDLAKFLAENPTIRAEDIPADLLTASGSGLDPHISPDSATIQIKALSVTTGLSEEDLSEIVKSHTSGKFLGVFGENTVNVLKVNLDIAQKIGMF